METTELKMIKLSALVPSKTNPRKLFDEAALQELAASIKENGVLQPIVVRKQGKTKYEVVCGARWRSSHVPWSSVSTCASTPSCCWRYTTTACTNRTG